MKATNIYTATLSRTIPAKALRYVFDALDDEATPYEARVAKVLDGKRLITLSIRKEDKRYFQKLIQRACDEAK